MEKNNNSFSENLDDIDSQEKAALLDELELIILQKKEAYDEFFHRYSC